MEKPPAQAAQSQQPAPNADLDAAFGKLMSGQSSVSSSNADPTHPDWDAGAVHPPVGQTIVRGLAGSIPKMGAAAERFIETAGTNPDIARSNMLDNGPDLPGSAPPPTAQQTQLADAVHDALASPEGQNWRKADLAQEPATRVPMKTDLQVGGVAPGNFAGGIDRALPPSDWEKNTFLGKATAGIADFIPKLATGPALVPGMFLQMAGEKLKQLQDQGVDADTALGAATANSAVKTAIFMALSPLAKVIGARNPDELIEAAKPFVRRWLTQTAEGAAAGAGMSATDAATNKLATGQPLLSKPNLKDAAEQAAQQGVMSAVIAPGEEALRKVTGAGGPGTMNAPGQPAGPTEPDARSTLGLPKRGAITPDQIDEAFHSYVMNGGHPDTGGTAETLKQGIDARNALRTKYAPSVTPPQPAAAETASTNSTANQDKLVQAPQLPGPAAGKPDPLGIEPRAEGAGQSPQTAVPPAAPWPKDFPGVVTHGTLGQLYGAGVPADATAAGDRAGAPTKNAIYRAAKSGDVEAAHQVVANLIDPAKLAQLGAQYPDATVVSVHADEAAGKNKLPQAYAEAIGDIAGLKVDDQIVQTNRTLHTGADQKQRLLAAAKFDGSVEPGRNYIVADDVVTSGATLAQLKQYIEARGGKVVAATTLASANPKPGQAPATELPIRPATEQAIRRRFDGAATDAILQSNGIAPSIQHLTEGQGRALLSFGGLNGLRGAIAARGQAADQPAAPRPPQPPAPSGSIQNAGTVTPSPEETPQPPAALPRAKSIAESTPGYGDRRDKLQQWIAAGKPLRRDWLAPFRNEPWADDQLARLDAKAAAKKPAPGPDEPATISVRRAELQKQLRNQVANEIGPDELLRGQPDARTVPIMRGQADLGGMLPLDKAIAHAQTLAEDHPARITLHNLQELEKNPRGTKIVRTNTNDLADGTRIEVNKDETFTVDKEEQVVRDGITAPIPDGGIDLYGKKILPPAEHQGEVGDFAPGDQESTPAAQKPAPQQVDVTRSEHRPVVPMASKDVIEAKKPAFTDQSQKGIFGQPTIDSSGMGDQKPMFHEPVDVKRPEDKPLGSREANNPDNTGKIFGFGKGKVEGKTGAGEPPRDPQEHKELAAALTGGFIQEDVKPTAAAIGKALVEAKTSIQRLLAPQTRGPLARQAANMWREHGATLARRMDQARQTLRDAWKHFDTLTPAQGLDFIDRMEHGQPQANPALNDFSQTMRELLDGRREEVRALGKGKLQEFIENYFPHIWKDPEKAASILQQVMSGKKPLEGSKNFLKQRTIPTVKEGVDLGMEPLSTNPVEMVLAKLSEMDKYILGQRYLAEMKTKKQVKFVNVNEQAPEGYTKIDDKIFTVYGPPTVKIKEHIDRDVYEGLTKVAKSLGIKHERLMDLPGQGTLGLSYQGGDKIQTQFATETSVLAHELGHQLDVKYNLYKNLLVRSSGKGHQPGRSELRKIADMTERGSAARSKAEKIAQVLEAYIHTPERMQQIAPRVYRWFDKFLRSYPELEPLTQIRPGLALKEIEGEKPHGGLLTMGHYYAPEPVANVTNNYLSPGLRAKSGAFRGYLGVANTMNQANLGLSFFHTVFTSLYSMADQMAIGMRQIVNPEGRDIAAGVKAIATSPGAPIRRYVMGNKVLREWFEKTPTGGELSQIVDGMMAAGGRAPQDQLYVTNYTRNMMQAFRRWNVVGGVMRLPSAIIEKVAAPTMEKLVPALKAGAFMDRARMEMGNLPPDASRDDVREALRPVWDDIDNGLGQIVYDNLFWNKTVKDLGMAAVRSLGWSLGSERLIGGATADFAREGAKAARGQRPELTHRMALMLAITLTAGSIGALLTRLMTGKAPQELKDYFFPRTGETNADGTPVRLALPTYLKDVYAYATHPLQTIAHKAHPAITAAIEMLENRDYYGNKIRNEDDPMIRQATDELEFFGKQFVPFSAQGVMQMKGQPLSKQIMPMVGLTPAPRDLSETPAEQLARQIDEEDPGKPRTQQEADRSQQQWKLVGALRQNPDQREQLLADAQAAGTIRPDQSREMVKRSTENLLQGRLEHMEAADAIRVWRVASSEERGELQQSMLNKIARSKTLDPAQRARLYSEVRGGAASTSSSSREPVAAQ